MRTYPPFMNTDIQWPEGVAAGEALRKAHDVALLEDEIIEILGLPGYWQGGGSGGPLLEKLRPGPAWSAVAGQRDDGAGTGRQQGDQQQRQQPTPPAGTRGPPPGPAALPGSPAIFRHAPHHTSVPQHLPRTTTVRRHSPAPFRTTPTLRRCS